MKSDIWYVGREIISDAQFNVRTITKYRRIYSWGARPDLSALRTT